jgi:2-methylisocitrate lyase-like PEP mutase family enzyme
MNNTKQLYLAEQFQELHHRNKMFVLPNAWDVGSAVIYEKSNFPAIGTTSAGFAYSLGYSDGEKIDFEYIVQIVKLITERLSIAIERGNAFHKSGSDCVFVPGAIEEGVISKLIENISAPINIFATPMTSNLGKLEQLGVRRLSLGSAPVRAVYSNLIESIQQIQNENKISKLLNHDFSYEIVNRIFSC